MRHLIAVAVLLAFLVVASPAAAATGLHVAPTADADAAGCYGLDVWNGDQLVKTLPADDGDQTPVVECAFNVWSAVLSNGPPGL